MLKCHVVLFNLVYKLNDVGFDNMLLPAFVEHRIEVLLADLEELNDVVLTLQVRLCRIRQSRVYCGSVLDEFATVEVQLNQTVRIVHRPVFQSSCREDSGCEGAGSDSV